MLNIDFKLLFDTDSFVETLAYISGDGSQSDAINGCFTGYGTIANRLVFTAVDSGEKHTVVHGTNFVKKVVRTIEAASVHRAPFILCLLGSYFDVSAGASSLAAYSELIASVKRASGVIPLIFVSGGECYGIDSVLASMFDFAFLCGNDSTIAAASDTAVNISSGRFENSNMLKFDASHTASCSAAVSGSYIDPDELKNALSDLFEYLPDSAFSGTPSLRTTDQSDRFDDHDRDIDTSLKGRDLLRSICDNNTFYEISGDFCPGTITCFGRVYGITAGFICFDSGTTEGLIDIRSLEKMIRFLKFCVSFGIPVVKLIDFTGVSAVDYDAFRIPSLTAELIDVSDKAERSISIVTGSACGMAAAAFIRSVKDNAGSISFAWKNSYIDAVNPAAAALMKYSDEIRNSSDPAAARIEFIEQYKVAYSRADRAAEKGLIDDVIDPGETRNRIASYLKIL